MRFALSTTTATSPSRLPAAWRTLPLAALLLGLASCSSTPEVAEEPPTPRAVTRAEVQSGRTQPPSPPPLREEKSWLRVPRLWPFGAKEEEEAVVAAPAPNSAPAEAAARGARTASAGNNRAASEVAAQEQVAQQEPAEERKPGFFRRAAGALPFVGSDDPDDIPPPPRSPRNITSSSAIPQVPDAQRTRARSKELRGLELLVTVNPQSPSMSDDRRLGVNLMLVNNGRRSVALRFGSTQTREILIRDVNGGIVSRWSEDYVFERSLSSLVINPGERVEFKETISTRELAANRDYLLDVGIQGYSELQVSIPLRTRP